MITKDAEYVNYELWLGSFEGENFKWKLLKKFNSWSDAYKEYKSFVNKQLSYTDEEVKEVWDSPRLDIELRQDKKMLNWVGLYSRKVDKLEEEEEAEADSKAHK